MAVLHRLWASHFLVLCFSLWNCPLRVNGIEQFLSTCEYRIDLLNAQTTYHSGILNMPLPESMSNYQDPRIDRNCDVTITFSHGTNLLIEIYYLDIIPDKDGTGTCTTGLEVLDQTGRNIYGGRLCMEAWEWEERHALSKQEKKVVQSSPLIFRLVSEGPYKGNGFKVHFNQFRPQWPCSNREFKCEELQRCVSDDLTCDGWDDCGDHTDERREAGCDLLTPSEICGLIIGILLFLGTVIATVLFCVTYHRLRRHYGLRSDSKMPITDMDPALYKRYNSQESMGTHYSRTTGGGRTRRGSDSSVEKLDLEKLDRLTLDNQSERSYRSNAKSRARSQALGSEASFDVPRKSGQQYTYSGGRRGRAASSNSLNNKGEAPLKINGIDNPQPVEESVENGDKGRVTPDRRSGRGGRRRSDDYSDEDDDRRRRRRSRDRRRRRYSDEDDDDYDSDYERRRRRRRRSYSDDDDSYDSEYERERRRRRRSKERKRRSREMEGDEEDPNKENPDKDREGSEDRRERRRRSRERDRNRDSYDSEEEDRRRRRRRRSPSYDDDDDDDRDRRRRRRSRSYDDDDDDRDRRRGRSNERRRDRSRGPPDSDRDQPDAPKDAERISRAIAKEVESRVPRKEADRDSPPPPSSFKPTLPKGSSPPPPFNSVIDSSPHEKSSHRRATPPRREATPPRREATPPRREATPPRREVTPPYINTKQPSNHSYHPPPPAKQQRLPPVSPPPSGEEIRRMEEERDRRKQQLRNQRLGRQQQPAAPSPPSSTSAASPPAEDDRERRRSTDNRRERYSRDRFNRGRRNEPEIPPSPPTAQDEYEDVNPRVRLDAPMTGYREETV